MSRGKQTAANSAHWILDTLEPRKLLSAAVAYPLLVDERMIFDVVPVTDIAPSDGTTAPTGDETIPSDPDGSENDEWTEWVPEIEVQWNGKFGPEVHTNNHFEGVVSTFKLIDPSKSVSATLEWSDGETSAGTIVNNGDGTFSVVGSHDFSEAGSQFVSATITSGDDAAWDGKSLLMGATGMTAIWEPHAFASGLQDTQEFCIGMFVDPNSSFNLSDYQVTINWGDGTTSAGTLDYDSDGNFYVSGTHAYSQAGTFDLSYTVNKADGSTMTSQGQAFVWDQSFEQGVIYLDAGMETLDGVPMVYSTATTSAPETSAATDTSSSAPKPLPAAAPAAVKPSQDQHHQTIDDLAGQPAPPSVL